MFILEMIRVGTSMFAKGQKVESDVRLIHSDVWGPTQIVKVQGSRYFVTLIDDYARHTWTCLIAKKSEFFSYFLKVKSLIERETGRKIKCLRSDGGIEYFPTSA